MSMKIYLVGGAVRDRCLYQPVKDQDYVISGVTPDQAVELKPLGRNLKPVGAGFPVFLCEEHGEEFAMARSEEKTGSGYVGFTFKTSPEITIEQDLMRRDLTINAMAIEMIDGEPTGEVIDPFGGRLDLEKKILRHTSEAFSDDPVRVLRIARFRARLGADWKVAAETRLLIHKMAKKGVLSELQPDRVWKEMSRALMEPFPRLFFDTLMECDALKAIFPEIYILASALESHYWHPEGNAYEHTMLVLSNAARWGYSLDLRVACLCHDLGKGLTPRELMPSHFGHDKEGVPVTNAFCRKNGVPAKIRDKAMHVTRWHMMMHKITELKPKTILNILHSTRALNGNFMIVDDLVFCNIADALGRKDTVMENRPPHVMFANHPFLVIANAANRVGFSDVFPDGEMDPKKIVPGLERARMKAIAEAKAKINDRKA